jgi:hypothetical protein
MFLDFHRNWGNGMLFSVFLHSNADEDHECNEGHDAFFFRGEDEEVHRSGFGDCEKAREQYVLSSELLSTIT